MIGERDLSAARVMNRRRTQSNVGVRHLIEGLNREDAEFRRHLLNAALVGLRLSRNPKFDALRHDAAEARSIIEPRWRSMRILCSGARGIAEETTC